LYLSGIELPAGAWCYHSGAHRKFTVVIFFDEVVLVGRHARLRRSPMMPGLAVILYSLMSRYDSLHLTVHGLR
jgi:hypothetical protein